MRRIVRGILWAIAGGVMLVALLLAGRLALNLLHAATRGSRSLATLAVAAEQPVRDAAQAALDDLRGRRFGRGIDWVAVVAPATSRDTVVLGLFRASDATIAHRLLNPNPALSGVARYAVAEHRLVYLGVGIR